MMDQMNKTSQVQLKTNTVFIENLLVLLVAYFNFGMCQLKIGSRVSQATEKVPMKARRSLEEAS